MPYASRPRRRIVCRPFRPPQPQLRERPLTVNRAAPLSLSLISPRVHETSRVPLRSLGSGAPGGVCYIAVVGAAAALGLSGLVHGSGDSEPGKSAQITRKRKST